MFSSAILLLGLCIVLVTAIAPAAPQDEFRATERNLPADTSFFRSSGEIDEDVTVTFVLETDSGMGMDPGASQFFVHYGARPLEWRFRPANQIPMTHLSGSVYRVDVPFAAGSPRSTLYKYSAILNDTGTKTFEAIRLDKWDDAARPLVLPTDGSALVITDYLGAASAPLRVGASGRASLYSDPRRGDAGVRQRHTVLFQLDLSERQMPSNPRILVLGSDPLRGFNHDGSFRDFPADPVVGWASGGIELFDDGTHGDLVAGDSIFSRRWSFTETGIDSLINPEFPYSLVDGGFARAPYFGAWANRRSPRSLVYRYFIKDMDDPDPNVFWASPSSNIELYLEHDAPDHIEIPPHVWDISGDQQSVAHQATITDIRTVGDAIHLVFTNIIEAMDNEVQIAATPREPWGGYGLIATGSGIYTVTVQSAQADSQTFRILTPGRPTGYTWWEPAFLPPGGESVRIWFQQRRKNLADIRDIYWFGANPSPGPYSSLPMTFAGDGLWYIDLNGVGVGGEDVRFFFIDRPFDPDMGWISGTREDKNMYPDGDIRGPLAGDFCIMIGGRATWSPDPVPPGQDLTVTYDAVGGPLEGSSAVNIWLDFDGWENLQPWYGGNYEQGMAAVGPNIWQVTVTVPLETQATVNFVFKAQDGSVWDDNLDSNGEARTWQAFVRPDDVDPVPDDG